MENKLIRIEQRQSERRVIQQQADLDRRVGQDRREAAEDAMLELRRSTRRHQRALALQRQIVEQDITAWRNRFYEARRAV